MHNSSNNPPYLPTEILAHLQISFFFLSAEQFTKRRLDVAHGGLHGSHGEDRNYNSVAIDLARQVC